MNKRMIAKELRKIAKSIITGETWEHSLGNPSNRRKDMDKIVEQYGLDREEYKKAIHSSENARWYADKLIKAGKEVPDMIINIMALEPEYAFEFAVYTLNFKDIPKAIKEAIYKTDRNGNKSKWQSYFEKTVEQKGITVTYKN